MKQRLKEKVGVALAIIGPVAAGFNVATYILSFLGAGALARWIIDHWFPFTRWVWENLFLIIELPNVTDSEKDALTTLVFFMPLGLWALFFGHTKKSLRSDHEFSWALKLAGVATGIVFLSIVGLNFLLEFSSAAADTIVTMLSHRISYALIGFDILIFLFLATMYGMCSVKVRDIRERRILDLNDIIGKNNIEVGFLLVYFDYNQDSWVVPEPDWISRNLNTDNPKIYMSVDCTEVKSPAIIQIDESRTENDPAFLIDRDFQTHHVEHAKNESLKNPYWAPVELRSNVKGWIAILGPEKFKKHFLTLLKFPIYTSIFLIFPIFILAFLYFSIGYLGYIKSFSMIGVVILGGFASVKTPYRLMMALGVVICFVSAGIIFEIGIAIVEYIEGVSSSS